MNLECPKCGAENTKKLSIVMAENVTQKGVRLGAAYMYNVWLPFMAIGVGLLVALILSIFSWQLGVFAFCVCLVLGYMIRSWAKAKFRPKYANLPAPMKERGFVCGRCEHLFVPLSD